MIKKVLAVLLSALMVTVFAGPANAVDGVHATGWRCVAFDGTGDVFRKELCAQVRWDMQQDGTGSAVEWLAVTCEDGCSLFHPEKVGARWWDGGDGKTYRSWGWGDEPDNFSKDHGGVYGSDTGPMDYTLTMCGTDDRLWWRFRVWGAGGWQLMDKGHDENPSLCWG